MLSERLFVVVNGKPRVTHDHFFEISVTVTVDNPLMPSERTASIPLRCVGNPHVEQAPFRLAFAGAPCGTIQYGALFNKSIWSRTTPRTLRRRSIDQFGDYQRIAWLTFTDDKAWHAGPQIPTYYLQGQKNVGQLTTVRLGAVNDRLQGGCGLAAIKISAIKYPSAAALVQSHSTLDAFDQQASSSRARHKAGNLTD